MVQLFAAIGGLLTATYSQVQLSRSFSTAEKMENSKTGSRPKRHLTPLIHVDSESKGLDQGADSSGEDDRDSTAADPTFKPPVTRHKSRRAETVDTQEENCLIPESTDPISKMLEMMRMEQERRADREERMEEQRLKEASKREEILCNLIQQLDKGRKEDNRMALEKQKEAEEAKKEEREEREIRKAIPNLAPMTPSEDLQDFIEKTKKPEEYQRRLGPQIWFPYSTLSAKQPSQDCLERTDTIVTS